MPTLRNIRELKPLHPALEEVYERLMGRLLDAHLIGSTLVEGSTLSEREAELVLKGESIHGHSVDEHRELTNGRDAASFIHRIFFQRDTITTAVLDRAHELLLMGVGDPREKTPGQNRGTSGRGAFTLLVQGDDVKRFSYEHPTRVKTDYTAFIDFHLNNPLPETREEVIAKLARLYFQFQMLHPYTDGNGRLGRFLLSAKAASEKALFFRFEAQDGPEHLRIMMTLTAQYAEDKNSVEYDLLNAFLDAHFEEL